MILSKIRLNDPETIQLCEDTFLKAKVPINILSFKYSSMIIFAFLLFQTSYSILCRVASKLRYRTREEFEELLKRTIRSYESRAKVKGSSYDWLMHLSLAPQILERIRLDKKTVWTFQEVINERVLKKVIIKAEFEIRCYSYEGKKQPNFTESVSYF